MTGYPCPKLFNSMTHFNFFKKLKHLKPIEPFNRSRNDDKVGFLENDCDIFDGNWVWDESYQSEDCMFSNGRPDNFYTKWRWQPKDCPGLELKNRVIKKNGIRDKNAPNRAEDKLDNYKATEKDREIY
uniref:Trichome birefringence-like N-terminal domain-containing protein n=1 Tax=Solanum lycopersicum TaxID=4081 RepID=A0A3Q7GIP9_SOLLC